MKISNYLTILFFVLASQVIAQSNPDKDVAYTKMITQRVDKIVTPLGITDSTKARKVLEIIVQQYRNLNDIYAKRDVKLKTAKVLKDTNKSLAEEQIRNAENEVNAGLYNLHFDFISKLMVHLSPGQLEQVKDGMTYGVLPITFKAYEDMVLGLNDEQKLQIKVWLIEAREHAMDAGSSDEKHAWFGKYKGRINNYLSKAGYDMKKEGEEWQKRIKAAKK
jgi:hypothetical protein